MSYLLSPNVLMAAVIVGAGVWLVDAGRRYEVRREAARIEAANKRIDATNKSETERDSKEEAQRDQALTDAAAVLARNKFLASPELAEVLNRIR